ncbi:MAG: hypothetical protein ABSH06_31895 [Thermodesulfobacteriota bacterium]
MKKTVLVLILGIVLLAVFGPDAKAQIPKEGTTSFTSAYSGTLKTLPMGQEHVQVTYEIMGVLIGDTPEDLRHNTSFRCLGALHIVKGEYNDDSGFCVETRPDGDQIFSAYKGAGKLGGMEKGTSTIIGGTGKLVGIQGSGEFTGIFLRPAAEGTVQGYERHNGHYKLP